MARKRTRPVPASPQAVLPVQDLGAALAFWTGALGLAVLRTGAGWSLLQAPDGAALVLAAPGATHPWPAAPLTPPGGWVYLHRPDVDTLAATLQGRVTAALEDPYPGFRRLMVPSPDGHVAVCWASLPLADAQILDLYRQGPERLRQVLAGLDDRHLDLTRSPGKWTIRQTVHHLVESDLGTWPVLHLALGDPGRTLRPNVWDSDVLARNLAYGSRRPGPAVALLATAREWVLDLVSHLPDALERHARWPGGGRAVVREVLRHAGGHALHHILQIEATRNLHRV